MEVNADGNAEEVEEVAHPHGANYGKKHLNDEQKQEIIQLSTQGESQRNIAKKLGVAKTTIHNLLRKWKSEKTLNRPSKQGKKRISAASDRFIAKTVRKDQSLSAKAIKEAGNLTDVSIRTIYRRKKELQSL